LKFKSIKTSVEDDEYLENYFSDTEKTAHRGYNLQGESRFLYRWSTVSTRRC